jgi:tetratricopeptide (TPR) repeat protein
MSAYGPIARITAVTYGCIISLCGFLWPGALSPLYEMPVPISLLEPRFGLAVMAAVLLTALLIVLRPRWPGGLAAWIFAVLMLAPTSAAVRQGADLAPDRYSYVAGLGFAVLVGGAALSVIRLVQRGVFSCARAGLLGIIGLVGIAALGTASWSYAEVWRESETLWRWAVEVNPDCSVCHGKLGESVLGARDGARRATDTEVSFRRAIALRPDLPDAYFNLASALVLQGRYREAEEPLRSYTARAPENAADAERLGLQYLRQTRYEAAIPFLRATMEQRPDALGPRASLADALQGHARQLQAQDRTAEADRLAAESRSLSAGRRAEPAPR